MITHDVNSFVDFIKYSDTLDLISSQIVFRGQATRGALLPGIARLDPTKDTTKIERGTLEELTMLGASHLPGKETELGLLVRAQHFGLKTRLLDWTSNSLAALWFACADGKEGEVFVYALPADNLLLTPAVYDKSPFEASKTRVFRPRLNNPRVIAQDGWFTLHRYSETGKRFVALEKNKDTKDRLIELRVPGARRHEMLVALDRHGVSARSLLPDLSGLCKYLNWKLT